MIRVRFIVLFLLLLPCLMSGQQQELFKLSDTPLRIEITAQSEKETYRIIPCGSAGMILFYKSVEVAADNSTRWYFSFYDRNLQKVWVKSAPIISSLEFKDSAFHEDTLYLYFEADNKNRNKEVNFQILSIILRPGTFVLNNGTTPEPGTMVSFRVVRQTAFIGLTNEGNNSTFLILDLPTGHSNAVSLMGGEPSTLQYTLVDTNTLVFSVLITKFLSKKNTELYLCKYQPDGKKISEARVSNDNSTRDFINVAEANISETESLIAGIYSLSSEGKKSKETESTGVFASPFNTAVQESINFYNFLDMNSIRELLTEQDILSLRKKSMKKSQYEMEYSLDFSMILHEILPWNDHFIIAAEAYNPQYHTESFTDYDFYGRPFTNTYTVFDGYRFTGIILAAVDEHGKLVWDNAMNLRNVISFDLEPKVTLFPSGDELILAYLNEGKIGCRIIREAQVVEKTSYSELELMSANDKLLAEYRSRMVHWYDDYFLCSGYQEIRDISKGGNDKRMVFFCNKVLFDR